MSIARTTTGLIIRDQFNRADSDTVGNNWNEAFNAADIRILSNELKHDAVSQNSRVFRPADEAGDQDLILQVNCRQENYGVLHLYVRAATDLSQYYDFVISANNNQYRIIRNGVTEVSLTTGLSGGVDRLLRGILEKDGSDVKLRLYTAVLPNRQNMTTTPVLTLSWTDTSPLTNSGKSTGLQGGWNQDWWDEYFVCGRGIVVTGLESGYKVKLDSGTPVVESGGSVSFDVDAKPLPYTTITILDGADNPLESLTPSGGIFGGDEFLYTAPTYAEYHTTTAEVAADALGVFFCRADPVEVYGEDLPGAIPIALGIEKTVSGLYFDEDFERAGSYPYTLDNDWTVYYSQGGGEIGDEPLYPTNRVWSTSVISGNGWITRPDSEILGVSLIPNLIAQLGHKSVEYAGSWGTAELSWWDDLGNKYNIGFIIPVVRKWRIQRNGVEVASNSSTEIGSSVDPRTLRVIFIPEGSDLRIKVYGKYWDSAAGALSEVSRQVVEVIDWVDTSPILSDRFRVFFEHGNSLCDEITLCGRNVLMRNMPSGYKLQVDDRTAQVESNGVATYNVDTEPLAGTTVKLLDASDTVIATLTPPDGVYGGDVYEVTVNQPYNPPEGCAGFTEADWNRIVIGEEI